LNSDRGGSILVLFSGVAMSCATAIQTGTRLSLGVVISGVTTAVLASGARNVIWDIWKPADGATSSPTTGAPPPIPPAIVLVLFCLGVSGCGTAGAQAIKKCELNSLPQAEQGAIACAAAAVTSGGDVQSSITACAAGIVPSQFNCLIQGLVTWFKGRIPSHGQADSMTLAAVGHLQVWLNAHGGTACAPTDIERLSTTLTRRFGYAMVDQ
jgi:hypothetical protein